MSLTEIANRNFTDKGTLAYEAHGYTEEYGKYIPSKGKFTLIEIGYYHGDSARMWKEYNPDLRLVFIDIDSSALIYNKENSNLYIGNSTNPDVINEIVEDYELEGGFDFIIDDGSHYHSDILESFKLLYPILNKGGYYFIEDLHASQSQREKLIIDIHLWMKSKEIIPKSQKLICNNKLWVIEK